MSGPLVSVVIPTHNRNSLLVRAVKSVLAQIYSPCEVIVVDDCGNAELILQDFGDRVHYIRIPQTPYPAESRNAGMKNAHGKYIAFLDDDDIWFPEKLSRQVEVLEENPDIGLVCSNGYVEQNYGRKMLYLNRNVKNKKNMLNQEIMRDFVVTSSCVIRASLLEVTGNYYVGADLQICEDYDFSARFAAISRIWFDPQPSFQYTINPESVQCRESKSYVKYHRSVLTVLRRLKLFLQKTRRITVTSRILLCCRIQSAKCDVILNRIAYESASCTRGDYLRLFILYFYLFPFAVPKILKYLATRIEYRERSM
jgi:glycosyltransferase involved in cell wall biosynthesis